MKKLKISLEQHSGIEISVNEDNNYCKIILSSEKIIININGVKICQAANLIEFNNKEIKFEAEQVTSIVKNTIDFTCGASKAMLTPSSLNFNATNIEFELENKFTIAAAKQVNFN